MLNTKIIGNPAQVPSAAPEPANPVGPGQLDHAAQVADGAGLAVVVREGDLADFLQGQLVIAPLPRKRRAPRAGYEHGPLK